MKEYFGFKCQSVVGEEVNDLFNPNSGNTFGCVQNEYMIATDANCEQIDLFKCNGHGMSRVPYRAINTRFLGTVKPRNTQQQFAIDMLYDDEMTVKIIAGKFGTGKDFLMCSVAMDLIEHNKFDNIDVAHIDEEFIDAGFIDGTVIDGSSSMTPIFRSHR